MTSPVLFQTGTLDYDEWREQARALIGVAIPPAQVEWIDPFDSQPGLFSSTGSAPPSGPILPKPSGDLRVPKRFPELAQFVLCHRYAEKWSLLYRILWRLTRGAEMQLLANLLDDDVFAANSMAKEVRRDAHKMKAFVRFCRVEPSPGVEHYVAYHRPEHPIIGIVAPFFARRFSVLNWTILTPTGSATWSDGRLMFGPPASRENAPTPDTLEDFWKVYYANIFNPARANPRAMSKEMPKKYWSTLPEAEIIEELLAKAPERTARMVNRITNGDPPGAAEYLPATDNLEPARALQALKDAACLCRGCDLAKDATCTVFGEGPAKARIMLVGEQPGDQEDLVGRPFVGPAGELLNRALCEAGIDREQCYVTNAVKHFKWTRAPRGKRRLHAKPKLHEVRACKPWLEHELAIVQPTVLILLGSTAAQALFGPGFRVMQQRGRVLQDTAFATAVVPTIHPSAVLRAGDADLSRQKYELLVNDLRLAAKLLVEQNASG